MKTFNSRQSHTSPGQVLIIDDDKIYCDMLRQVVKLSGYEALIAQDGHEGLELFRKYSPTVVLLDLRMPQMDGIDFLQEVKPNEYSSYSVIMVSGEKDPDEIAYCRSLGATDFLFKPCDIRELRRVIKREFERRDHIKHAKDEKSLSLVRTV